MTAAEARAGHGVGLEFAASLFISENQCMYRPAAKPGAILCRYFPRL